MLGTYRLLLACLVLISHCGLVIQKMNPGVVAVISFFLISGYVVTGVYEKKCHSKAGFIVDRVLRIYPLFFVFLSLTLILLNLFPCKDTFLGYFITKPSLWATLLNYLLIPLDFYRFNASEGFQLIPPAWSLGLEMTFYLVFPFLTLKKVKVTALFLSLAFFCLAAFGVLETDLYGYRLLPGTLFLFLTGSLYYEDPESFLKRILPVLVVLIVVLWGALLKFKFLDVPFNREILVGYGFAIIALVSLTRLQRQKWDEILGALSYGVFLSHTLVIWGVDSLGGLARFGESGRIWLVILGSLVLATLGHLCVERPFHRLQLTLRRKPSPEP